MSPVIRATVLVLSLSLIACTTSNQGLAPVMTGVNPTQPEASSAQRSSIVDRRPSVIFDLPGRAHAVPLEAAAVSNKMHFLVSDRATGGLQEVSPAQAGLFEPVLSLTNGGDVSIEVQGPKEISSVSIDTGEGLVALQPQPGAGGRWQGRLHYLNLNNDPRVAASLTAIVSALGKNYKIIFPVKVVHDS